MDAQPSDTQRLAPMPWWKGLIIAFGLCCLILLAGAWLLSDDGKPKVSEPHHHYLTKAEKREEARRKSAEEMRLGLAAQQFWTNYEERKLTEASLDASSDRWASTKREGKHPAIYHHPPVQEPTKKIQQVPQATLPPVKLNTESTTPLSRERIRLHEDIVRNLLN